MQHEDWAAHLRCAVDVGCRRRVQAKIMRVMGHTNHVVLTVFAGGWLICFKGDPPAERILFRPDLVSQPFTDNHYMRLVADLLRREITPSDQPDAHGAEIIIPDGNGVCRLRLLAVLTIRCKDG